MANEELGWFSKLKSAIDGVEGAYGELTVKQRKILAGRGFTKAHMNALVRIRDEGIIPATTGRPAPPRVKPSVAIDPNQTTIYDFIKGGADASA